MKKQILILIFTFTAIFCNAQKGAINAKIDISFEQPVSNFNHQFKTGNGIYFSYYYGLSEKGSLLFHLGYNNWQLKDTSGKAKGGSLVPILAGYRYTIFPKLYLEGAAGPAIFGGIFDGRIRFNYNLGLSYLIKLNNSPSIDISSKFSSVYNGIKSYNWIEFDVGMFFSSLENHVSTYSQKR